MYAVSIVTRLLNEGLLDLKTGDAIYAHSEKDFLDRNTSLWEASAFVEVKPNHSSGMVRDKIPLRTTCTQLKRLVVDCKNKSVRAMRSVAFLYQVGYILPKSEILSQAWNIFATDCTPEIGGREITYKECLKELRKHLKSARSESPDGHFVYCKEYMDNVERWSAVTKDSDNGFLVYAFSSKTNTYILTDAFIRNGKSWVSVYGVFAASGLTPTAKRPHGIPSDIGKFNVSDRNSRIIIPITHNDPELTTQEKDHLIRLNMFHQKAFAPTMTAEQAEVSKFQAALEKAYAYIDARFSEALKELISLRGRTLAAREGKSPKELAKLRKEIVKQNAESEREAYSKYERKLKKHGEKVGRKYYKLFEQLGNDNQKRLADFTNETSVIASKYEERARKSTESMAAELTVNTDGMSDTDKLALQLKRLHFIYKHTSSTYDSDIDTVNSHTEKVKRYEKLVREVNASLKDVKTDKKHRELTKQLNKYTRLRTKYRSCLKNMEVQVDASRRQLRAAEAAVSTLKVARKHPEWISQSVNGNRKERLNTAKKFEVTPTGIICVTVNKNGKMKKGVKAKLLSVGFTV